MDEKWGEWQVGSTWPWLRPLLHLVIIYGMPFKFGHSHSAISRIHHEIYAYIRTIGANAKLRLEWPA
jgi:hypothetical protein